MRFCPSFVHCEEILGGNGDTSGTAKLTVVLEPSVIVTVPVLVTTDGSTIDGKMNV